MTTLDRRSPGPPRHRICFRSYTPQRSTKASRPQHPVRGDLEPRRFHSGLHHCWLFSFLPSFIPPVVSAPGHPGTSPTTPTMTGPPRGYVNLKTSAALSGLPNRAVGACISSTINRVIQVLFQSPNELLLIYGAVRSFTGSTVYT